MKNNFTLLAFLSIILISCSKEQRTVNKMEGKWNVVKSEIVGFGQDTRDLIFEFEYCRTRKNDACEFSIHDFDLDIVYPGTYSLSRDGKTIVLSFGTGTGIYNELYEIEKINRRRLILINDNASYGKFRRIELKSVK